MTGNPEQDGPNGTGRMGQAEQNIQNKIARIGQAEQERQNSQAEMERQNGTGRTVPHSKSGIFPRSSLLGAG